MPGLGRGRAGPVLGRHPRQGAAPVRPRHRRRPRLAAAAAVRIVRPPRVGRGRPRARRRVLRVRLRDRRDDVPRRSRRPAPRHEVQRRQGLPGRPVLRRNHGREDAARADRVAVPPRPGREPARGRRRADRLQRPGLERRRRHDVPLRQQGPGRLDLRLRRGDRDRREPPRARPAHRGDRPARRRRRRRRGLLLEFGDLRRRAQPLGARRVARPQHPPARVEPDLPLLRRPRPHDDLRDLAAPRPARRRARREAAAPAGSSRWRSTSPGYPSPASRASPQHRQERNHAERLHDRPRDDGHLALRGPSADARRRAAHRRRAAPEAGRRRTPRPQPAARRAPPRRSPRSTATRSGRRTSTRPSPTPRSTSSSSPGPARRTPRCR